MLSGNGAAGSSSTAPKEIGRLVMPSGSNAVGSLQDFHNKAAFTSGADASAVWLPDQTVDKDNATNSLPRVLRSPISRDQVVNSEDVVDSLPTAPRPLVPRGQLRSCGKSKAATDSLAEVCSAEYEQNAWPAMSCSADVGGHQFLHDGMRRIMERTDEIGHCVPDPLPRERSSTNDRLEPRGHGAWIDRAAASASAGLEHTSERWVDSRISPMTPGGFRYGDAVSGSNSLPQQPLELNIDASAEALHPTRNCGDVAAESTSQAVLTPPVEEGASLVEKGDRFQEVSSQSPAAGAVEMESVASPSKKTSKSDSHPRFSNQLEIIANDGENYSLHDNDKAEVQRTAGIDFSPHRIQRQSTGGQALQTPIAAADCDFESDTPDPPRDVPINDSIEEPQEGCSSSDEDCDLDEEPKWHPGHRRRGVSCEAYGAWNQRRAAFVPQSFNKSQEHRKGLRESLQKCPFFSTLDIDAVDAIAEAMSVEEFKGDDCIVRQGEFGRSGYVVLEGNVEVCNDEGIVPHAATGEDSTGSAPNRGTLIRRLDVGRFFGEITMLWGVPRTRSVYANAGCVLGKLKRDVYQNLVTRREMHARSEREECLRRVKMFETLNDEQVTHLADALEKRKYRKGEDIIKQGEEGSEFYVVLGGECVVLVATGNDSNNLDVQEYRRYYTGDLFGELALLKHARRSATVQACTQVEVMCLRRSKFERLLGSLDQLQQANYLSDPRKCIADFYNPGNRHGPSGVVSDSHSIPEEPSKWFAVYRPTSRDAIAKMLSGTAVGKGLNVKGKSAKKGRLSGYVPFLQIHHESHKKDIECSPPDARVLIFFSTEPARARAMMEMLPLCQPDKELNVEEWNRNIMPIDDFPDVFGLEVPEAVMREIYIERAELAFIMGWETGRKSEPAFMDMNLHAVRSISDPRVVLYQYDMENPMNPHGLLIAYAEDYVKPVVSDFDTFTVGSTNTQYAKIHETLQDLNHWALDRTHEILRTPSTSSWSTRWLSVLREAHDEGFEPVVPKYGFGDATSYGLTEAVVSATRDSGAVRHGAECFNAYFPQELDDHFLIVWEGFDDKPWDYMMEPKLREFLTARIREGFSFPVNPVWLVRDPGWYQIFKELNSSEEASGPLLSWFPPESGLIQKIEDIHKEFPEGFATFVDENAATSPKGRMSHIQDLDACERADMISLKAARLSDVTSSKPHRNSTATGSICEHAMLRARFSLSSWGKSNSTPLKRLSVPC